MKLLMAWDNPEEADLAQLYLGVDNNELHLVLTAESLLAQAQATEWDAILMTMAFPTTPQEAYPLFKQLQELQPDVPIIMACRPEEMQSLPRFMIAGLRFYVVRDQGGDYLFLLLTTIESALAAREAERSRHLAERLREEMDGVRKLQESIIPRGVTPPSGYRFVARYEPAQVAVVGNRPVVMAGGDYYDFFRPDPSTFVLLVGDASGHGLKACMSIMTMHTLVRMFSSDRHRDTAAFVAEINDRLCENSIVQSEGGFITLLYATLNAPTHELSWCSAGHPPALLHRLDTNEVIPVGSENDGGLPLGIAAGMDYSAQRLVVPPGCRVLLYSDGLTDALAPSGSERRQFGVEGISEVLRACQGCSVEEALDELFKVSHAFTGGLGRHDDTTAVLLERTL